MVDIFYEHHLLNILEHFCNYKLVFIQNGSAGTNELSPVLFRFHLAQ